MNILTNILALIVVLSVLVVVHEFGHFAVAKFFGFPVEVFSVGFGKRLFGRKWRGTDYRVSAIPLGGYVRVIGLGPDESTVTEGTSREAPPVGKRWQRALVLLAGPLMNLVLAFFLHTTVFAVGTRVPAYELEPPIVRVVEPDSPGAEAGFRPGDRVVTINGRTTPRWRDVLFIFGMNAREPLNVEVDRGGQTVTLRVTPRPSTKYDLGYVGLLPDFGANVRAKIAQVVSGSPAAHAGLKAGDVVALGGGEADPGRARPGLHEVRRGRRRGRAGPVSDRVPAGRPHGQRHGHAPQGRRLLEGRRAGHGRPAGSRRAVPSRPVVRRGLATGRNGFQMTLAVIGRLFRGTASMKSMSGPLDIAKFSGEAARTGAVPLVAFMAAISLQLGIFNLLPIPVLDGGHLFLLTLEGIARRDFSLRVKERILQVGFVMILALLAVVLYNDVAKNVSEKWWPF